MARQLRAVRWVMTLATVLILVLLAWQCLSIFLAGNSPSNLDANGVHLTPVFSAQIVSAHLRPLLPLLAVYVLLVLGGLIAQAAGGSEGVPASLSAENRLRLVKARVAVLPTAAEGLERQRRSICFAAAAAVLVCAVPCLVYLLNGENFRSWDLELVMGQMLLHVAPWATAAFTIVIVSSFACARSAEREIAVLRDHMEPGRPGSPAARRWPVGILRLVLYAAAAVFIMLGVMNGGLRDVLVKAINICTECIGLG